MRLTKLSEWKRLSSNYRQLIAIHCPQVKVLSTSHLMTVALPAGIERQAISDHLHNQGIQTISPHTEGQLTLPLHPEMTIVDVVRIVNCLSAALDTESLSETIA